MMNKLKLKKGDIVNISTEYSFGQEFFRIIKQKSTLSFICFSLNKRKTKRIFWPIKILDYRIVKRFKSDYELLVYLKLNNKRI